MVTHFVLWLMAAYLVVEALDAWAVERRIRQEEQEQLDPEQHPHNLTS